MEMTLESLVAAGYTAEQANAILAAHKASIANAYIPIARFNEVNTQLANANTSIKERDTQIEGLKKFEGTATELQAKVAQLTTENKTKDTEMATKLAEQQKRFAMAALLTGKVHDPDLVISQIDASKVSIGQDGKLVGFEDQLKPLQEKKKFLFVETAEPKKNPYAGFNIVGTTPPEGGESPAKQDTPEAFGAALAKRKAEQLKASNDASSHYFK